MRTAFLILFSTAVLIFFSCQKEIIELPQRNQSTQVDASVPKLIKKTVYDSSGVIDYILYATIIEDSIQRTITIKEDTTIDYYFKYYHDNNGKLIKVDINDQGLLQTMNISRSGNQISWSSTNTNSIATIADLPANKKQIDLVEQAGSTPMYKKFITNANNALEMRKDSFFIPNQVSVTNYFYSSSGKLDSINISQQQSPQTLVHSHIAFTKDNNNNQYWIRLIEKIYGPDLLWAGTTRIWLPQFFTLNSVSDREFLMGGSNISESSFSEFISASSGNIISTYGPIHTSNTLTYDSQNRITKQILKISGKVQYMTEITY